VLTSAPSREHLRPPTSRPAGPERQGPAARHGVSQRQGEDFADGRLPRARRRQRQVRLDLVAVAAAVLLLRHITGLGQVGDDGVGAALGDDIASVVQKRGESRLTGRNGADRESAG
jgi:hypothetical protein